MTPSAGLATEPRAPIFDDRRNEFADSSICDLWMIDHEGGTVLKCKCLEVAGAVLRLRVPVGYGVAQGQRYELRSQVGGVSTAFAPVVSRWATVSATQLRVHESDDCLDVEVSLDSPLHTLPIAAAGRA